MQNKQEQPETLRRTFLGKKPGNGIKLNPFEKKELRAYTRGHSYFYHGIVRNKLGHPKRNNDGSILLQQHSVRVAYL